MAKNNHQKNPFNIKDCALIAIATGERAQNLRELKGHLARIDPNSIYYHFWGGLLRPRFDDPEYHNDFAIWVAHGLNDKVLAERLAAIDPVNFQTLDQLRKELIEIIEERLDEIDMPLWTRRDDQFEFIRSQIVVFDTKIAVKNPADFSNILPKLSVGSIFFHFIDGRRRNPIPVDDFRNWLLTFGEKYSDLCLRIGEIDPYFSPLTKLRDELSDAFMHYFDKENQ